MTRHRLFLDTLRVQSFILGTGSPLSPGGEPGAALPDEASVTSCTLGPDCDSAVPDLPC